MTNPLISRIHTLFNTAAAELTAVIAELYAKANADRESLLAIIASMQNTRATVTEISAICSEQAELFANIAEDGERLASQMTDAIDDPLETCPKCTFEELIGFCEECGCEITDDNAPDHLTADLLCATCDAALSEAIED